MTTGATLFSGGELAGVGMRRAGIDHRWGIEIDPDIAGAARANGFNVLAADVLAVDPAQMEPVDCLHASPVCTRASSANQSAELNEDGTKEAPLDVAMGEKVAQFIDTLQPRIFTLENVFAYRNFKAFKIICAALSRNGYWWDFDNLNSADYGVPQTRRRLILRTVRGALLPMLPRPEWWRGWYGSIEDLVPGLPESHFAPWQLERLPALLQTTLVDQLNMSNNNGACTHRAASEPAISVIVHPGRHPAPKAFILSNAKTEYGDGIRYEAEPVHTVTGESNGRTRAWLVSSIDCTARRDDQPVSTIVGVGDGHSVSPKAWLSQGRVVSMTPRALARFQSVPDDYGLPETNKLACKIIGNGVPCLLMEKIYKQLVS